MFDETEQSLLRRTEAMLFVAGEPVGIPDLARVLGISTDSLRALLLRWEEACRTEGRGLLPFVAQESIQLITNPLYARDIEDLLQPEQTKSASRSVMETLAVVAYRQPVTRAEMEAVRGVRCEYAVKQLLKAGLITPVGRKDALGHPILYGTTEAFLHRFSLHGIEELPGYGRFSSPEETAEALGSLPEPADETVPFTV